ncbi:kinase-like domain-containing protein [Aspergillus filifer]
MMQCRYSICSTPGTPGRAFDPWAAILRSLTMTGLSLIFQHAPGPPHHQRGCSYKSHVQIFYECSNCASSNERTSQCRFVKEKTSINVPDILKDWEEDDGHTMTLMRRVPGVPLSEAWPALSNEERENVAGQTAESLLELRKLQSDTIHFLKCRGRTSDEALWKEMESGIPDSIPSSVRERLRQIMPPAQPYTFIHGDLTDVNIMVENGCFSGIIDWKRAAYLPVWWEYANTSILNSEEDYGGRLRQGSGWRTYHWLLRETEHEVARAFIEETMGKGVEGV